MDTLVNRFRSNSLDANIWKVYLYRFFGSFVFTMPVWVLYLQDLGISLTQVMILHAVYTLIILFLTIPFGALADLKGRKYVLIISQIAVVIGYIVYIISDTFFGFLIGEILFGISTASFFGVLEALIYDTLKQTKNIKSYKKVQGNTYAINDFLLGFGGLLGAFIAAAISKQFTFIVSLVPLMFALILLFWIKEPKHSTRIYQANYFTHIKETFKFASNHVQVRRIIIFSALIGTFTFVTFLMNSVYFEKNGISIQYIGLLYTVMFTFSALGAKIYHLIEKKLDNHFSSMAGKLVPLIIIGIPALFLTLCYFVNPWLGVPLVILVWLSSVGFRATYVADFINKHISSHHRATVMSINVMIGNIFFAIVSPIFGKIADLRSVPFVYMIMGIVLMVYLGFNIMMNRTAQGP